MPPFYDSLLAKLIAHGEDRHEAIEILLDGLHELRVEGVKTNRTLLIELLGHPAFAAGPVTTGWLESAI